MSSLRALLVDDEPRARKRLRRLLRPHADVVVVAEAATGEEAVRQAMQLQPDVVFLDIRMPGGLGTDAAATLRDYLPDGVRPALVFTTAHADHAVEAFALEGVHFLLKPIERDALAEALRRVRRAHWQRSPTPSAPPPPADTAPEALTGHRGADTLAVPVHAIRTVQVEDAVAFAHTVHEERIRLGGSLAEAEAQLPTPPFVRVSRSAIVHAERVVTLHRQGSAWEAELEGGQRVRVSRRRVKGLEALLGG